MNKDIAEGNWKQLTGKIKSTWGKMTDDDAALYQGKAEQFYGKLQEKHGIARDEAEKKMKEFEKSCGCSTDTSRAA